MQAERDHLRTHVFPALEERLRSRRRHLEWVDLRLGVVAAPYQDAEMRELQGAGERRRQAHTFLAASPHLDRDELHHDPPSPPVDVRQLAAMTLQVAG